MRGLVIIFLVISCLAGCMASHPEKKRNVMTVDVPWSLTYRDGSGNGFRFWQEAEEEAAHFTYTPVTPAMSSSGVYSGGEPQEGVLDAAQIESLWQEALRLEADTTLHINARMMGSGVFSLTTPEGKRSFLVKGGAALRTFNELVGAFRG